ncbi:MAG: ABC transporter permease [Puniceicoccaceae bacterium]
MIQVFRLTRHELKSLFYTPSTYIAMVLSLLMMGFFYFVMLETISSEEQDQLPPTIFFSLFWVPVLLIVPMLTMRSIAEERRLGTIETLLTAPVQPSQLVLSKFLAAYIFYMLVWVLAMAYPILTAFVIDQPEFNEKLFHTGATTGGYLFISASGALFIAIGIFTSSLTRSQLVAGMLSFSILFMLIVGVAAIHMLQIETATGSGLPDTVLDYFQLFEHFDDFSRGLIDTRPFVYYFSGTIAVLGFSVLVIESKS